MWSQVGSLEKDSFFQEKKNTFAFIKYSFSTSSSANTMLHVTAFFEKQSKLLFDVVYFILIYAPLAMPNDFM